MTTKLLLKVSLLSLIFCVNGQFKHFPVQAGRPDSPTNVRQQQETPQRPQRVQETPQRPQRVQPVRPRPAPALVDVEENEVIPPQVNRNRGRGRSRGAQNTPQRVQETPQRVQETPQRPQRGRVPERSREVPQTTNLRVESSRVPVRRPEPRPSQVNFPPPAVEPKQRQRIRIRPKPTEAPQAAPTPSTPRARLRTPDAPVTTPTPQRLTPVSSDEAAKQTFGQSLSGIFDPSQLTVFGDNRVTPVREEKPRLIRPVQETPQQQFRMPDIPKVRTLPGPKIVSRPPVESSDVRQDIGQGFLPVQELVREEPARPVPAPQKPVQQVQPFTHFQAQQQPATQPRPLPFQAQPAIPQPQPAVPQLLNRQQPQPAVPQQQPSFTVQQFNRPQPQPAVPQQQLSGQPQPAVPQQQLSRQPQPAVPQQQLNRQPQPEIRQPQPIPFQTRPATPRQLAQPSPPQQRQQQASSDFFQDTLFSKPIEIPSNAGGASFSYEAILG